MAQFCYDFAAHERDLEGNYVVPDMGSSSPTGNEKRDNAVSVVEADATHAPRSSVAMVSQAGARQSTEDGRARDEIVSEKTTTAGKKEAAAPRMPATAP
jgi:hypothetical protein